MMQGPRQLFSVEASMNCVCVATTLVILPALCAPFGLHCTHNLDRHFNTIHTPCLARHCSTLGKPAQDCARYYKRCNGSKCGEYLLRRRLCGLKKRCICNRHNVSNTVGSYNSTTQHTHTDTHIDTDTDTHTDTHMHRHAQTNTCTDTHTDISIKHTSSTPVREDSQLDRVTLRQQVFFVE